MALWRQLKALVEAEGTLRAVIVTPIAILNKLRLHLRAEMGLRLTTRSWSNYLWSTNRVSPALCGLVIADTVNA